MNNNIDVLEWPGNSPDMNPIEALWAIIKRRIQRETVTSKADLIKKLLDLCARDTDLHRELNTSCRKLVEGMPARINSLLKSKGHHTNY